MKRPEMILFDYGHTLLCEPDFSTLNGTKALMGHVTANPDSLTAEQINEFVAGIYKELYRARKIDIEVHEHNAERFAYEYLGIEFDIPYPEVERIYWEATTKGEIMPHIDELIDYLNENGIRTGVVSNIGWSESALTQRINRLIPHNRFEFIIATSEYVFRKPDKMIFELALRKANLSADKVWYCGDSIKFDVMGAHGAGIFPIHYDEHEIENLWADKNTDTFPDFEYLRITDWRELINILDNDKCH